MFFLFSQSKKDPIGSKKQNGALLVSNMRKNTRKFNRKFFRPDLRLNLSGKIPIYAFFQAQKKDHGDMAIVF